MFNFPPPYNLCSFISLLVYKVHFILLVTCNALYFGASKNKQAEALTLIVILLELPLNLKPCMFLDCGRKWRPMQASCKWDSNPRPCCEITVITTTTVISNNDE